MELTPQQIANNLHISTEKIEKDIIDTAYEITVYRSELEVLYKNRTKNKLEIYYRESNIHQREEFITFLEALLKTRKIAEP